jgi:succinate dehydrogenase/fumarate reductase-like Fe-S protein
MAASQYSVCVQCLALQDECLRLMLQRRQYSGAAGLMRALLHMRGIPTSGLP